MYKADLLKFIDLYYLSGAVERVKIESDGALLTTNFMTEHKTLYGNLSYKGLNIEAGEYGIHDTKQLKKMLSILDDEVTVTVVRLSDNRPVGLSFSDKHTESLAMLADLSVIPKAATGVNIGTIDLEIKIDAEFIARYIRAKDALKDVPTFTLLTNKKGIVELVIGHSNINTNRIRLDVEVVAGMDKPENIVTFDADFFREILNQHKDVVSTVFRVNSLGLGHLHFSTKEYDANYYLLKVTSQ